LVCTLQSRNASLSITTTTLVQTPKTTTAHGPHPCLKHTLLHSPSECQSGVGHCCQAVLIAANLRFDLLYHKIHFIFNLPSRLPLRLPSSPPSDSHPFVSRSPLSPAHSLSPRLRSTVPAASSGPASPPDLLLQEPRPPSKQHALTCTKAPSTARKTSADPIQSRHDPFSPLSSAAYSYTRPFGRRQLARAPALAVRHRRLKEPHFRCFAN
jgi:hypothetical protein